VTWSAGLAILLLLSGALFREEWARRRWIRWGQGRGPAPDPQPSSWEEGSAPTDAQAREALLKVLQHVPSDGWLWVAVGVLAFAPAGANLLWHGGQLLATWSATPERAETAVHIHRHLDGLANSLRESAVLWLVAGIPSGWVASRLRHRERQRVRAVALLQRLGLEVGAEPLPTTARLGQLGLAPAKTGGPRAAGVWVASVTLAGVLLWNGAELRESNRAPAWKALWPEPSVGAPPAVRLARHGGGSWDDLVGHQLVMTEDEVRWEDALLFDWSEPGEVEDAHSGETERSEPVLWVDRRLDAPQVRRGLERVRDVVGMSEFRWVVEREFPDRLRLARIRVCIRNHHEGPVVTLNDAGARVEGRRFSNWIDPGLRSAIHSGSVAFRIDTEASIQSMMAFMAGLDDRCDRPCGLPGRDLEFVWLPPTREADEL
jgi:hypothetical protein